MSKNVTLLYCVSNYPSKISDFNLNNIKILKKNLNVKLVFLIIQLTQELHSAVAAGATVVEKHISLKNVKSLDSDFSIAGDDILRFKKQICNAKKVKKNLLFIKNS